MAGRMGGDRCTEENLRVVQIDAERNLLLVSGSVPGAPGGQVIVRPSVKALGQRRRRYVAPVKK
jgi:large subunit ribosomal protein L3